jgi:hypothetical protein
MDIFTKYNQNMSLVHQNMERQIDIYNKQLDLSDRLENQRYNQYIANNGVLLQNTSFNELIKEVENGLISPQKASDLKKVMMNSLVASLSKK